MWSCPNLQQSPNNIDFNILFKHIFYTILACENNIKKAKQKLCPGERLQATSYRLRVKGDRGQVTHYIFFLLHGVDAIMRRRQYIQFLPYVVCVLLVFFLQNKNLLLYCIALGLYVGTSMIFKKSWN